MSSSPLFCLYISTISSSLEKKKFVFKDQKMAPIMWSTIKNESELMLLLNDRTLYCNRLEYPIWKTLLHSLFFRKKWMAYKFSAPCLKMILCWIISVAPGKVQVLHWLYSLGVMDYSYDPGLGNSVPLLTQNSYVWLAFWISTEFPPQPLPTWAGIGWSKEEITKLKVVGFKTEVW